MVRTLKWLGLLVFACLLGAIIVLWTPDTKPSAMRAKYGSAASRYINFGDGLTVHVRDEGPRDAPVIVLLHGSNSVLQTWDGWTRSLVPDYRVIRFDQPGHGLTGSYPARDYTRKAFTAMVDRVTTKLGVTRFVLAGNSMGGGTAWAYAHQYPRKLTGLVLIDASGEPEPTDASPPLGFRIARTPVIRDLMAAITPRAVIADGLRQSVSDPAIATPAAIDRYWELLRYPGNRTATIDRFAAARDVPVTDGLPRAIPTLIMWGAEDKPIPVASAAWFKQRIPDASVIIYPKVGHLMMEEIPERSVADLKLWLAKRPLAR